MDQVNSLLRQELALSLQRHLDLDGSLVTITEVHCSADLSEAKVFVSVLPENQVGSALKKLRKLSGTFARDLRPRLKFHKMPVFIWLFDNREARAAALEEVFNEVS